MQWQSHTSVIREVRRRLHSKGTGLCGRCRRSGVARLGARRAQWSRCRRTVVTVGARRDGFCSPLANGDVAEGHVGYARPRNHIILNVRTRAGDCPGEDASGIPKKPSGTDGMGATGSGVRTFIRCEVVASGTTATCRQGACCAGGRQLLAFFLGRFCRRSPWKNGVRSP